MDSRPSTKQSNMTPAQSRSKFITKEIDVTFENSRKNIQIHNQIEDFDKALDQSIDKGCVMLPQPLPFETKHTEIDEIGPFEGTQQTQDKVKDGFQVTISSNDVRKNEIVEKEQDNIHRIDLR